MKIARRLVPAIGLAAAVSVARWVFECMFVVPLVPDPQSPIWIMISSVTSVFILVAVFALAMVALRGMESARWPIRVVAAAPLLILLGWFATGFVHLARVRSALLESADPGTSPARLRELAMFEGGPGYEVDNRVAKHPNTPPDVLRSLHGRPDQVGTEMCLAQNPNTPDDILREIATRNDEWAQYVVDALKRNPRYTQVFPDQDAAAPGTPVPPAP